MCDCLTFSRNSHSWLTFLCLTSSNLNVGYSDLQMALRNGEAAGTQTQTALFLSAAVPLPGPTGLRTIWASRTLLIPSRVHIDVLCVYPVSLQGPKPMPSIPRSPAQADRSPPGPREVVSKLPSIQTCILPPDRSDTCTVLGKSHCCQDLSPLS